MTQKAKERMFPGKDHFKIKIMLMKTKRLNCETARDICIVKTLENLGHLPSRRTEKEAWFLSPLRKETKASFKVSIPLNRWYDFGIGKGGNVVDLVCLILNCSVAATLASLSNRITVSDPYFKEQVTALKKEHKNRIIKVLPIEHQMLRKYLYSRRIPVEVAETYCKEIWYESNGRNFFALGLQNIIGGWELRNAYLKTSTSPKSYSYLRKGKMNLIILEGMFDLLSLVVMTPEEVENADLLILNSLSFLSEAFSVFHLYASVTLFFDHDPPGIKATNEALRKFPICKDGSSRYEGRKDLNETLLNSVHE